MFCLCARAEWERLFDTVFPEEQKDTHQREGDIREKRALRAAANAIAMRLEPIYVSLKLKFENGHEILTAFFKVEDDSSQASPPWAPLSYLSEDG